MKLKAELLNVKQTTNAQIKQVQSEFLQNSAIKESEKEIYSTALINLSGACSNNSAKLDDIKLMIMSQSEQFKADPLNPLQWLLTLQTSTIEDLVKLNSDTQNQLKSIATDFQNVLAIKEEQKELPSIQKFEEISALTTQNQTLEIVDSKKEIETQKEFESTQLEDSKQPGLYSTNETNDPKNYQASLLLRKKLDSSKMADQKVEFHSNNSAESNEWKEGKKNALQKASSDPDLHRAFVGSVEKNRQKPVPVLTERNNPASIYNQYQFTLNMNSENTFADGNYHTADQYSSSKEKSKQNLYSNYLNQVLFGNNNNNELNQTDAQQSEDLRETPLMTESDVNEYKSASQENSYRLCNFFQHPQFVRINGNALSNLQENIAQQLKQNEKRNAFQHLAKVQNNIHQYKSIRERVTEGAKRTSLKGNSLTASKRRGDSDTPSNKYPSPSTSSQRRATLFEKNLNVPENSKGYSSVRSTVSQSRAQLNYENVYRKPSNYPTQRERGVKVNLKHFMSENRRALETPDIHNYHEKFDFESPYHPANLSMRCHGSQPVRTGNGVFGMHVNVPGACNVGKNIDPNLHLRFSN